ncbi:MAG: tyrosine-type recombinase/integrase [Oscillospiraceae bacterium]
MIDEFKNYLIEAERSPNTITAYLLAVRQYIATNGNDFSKMTLINYKNHLKEVYAVSTVNLKIQAINRYLQFIGIPQHLDCIRVHKVPSAENIITLGEYYKLLNGLSSMHDDYHYFMLRTLGETGCRINELLQIKCEDIRKGYAEMFTKGKLRRIYIPDKLQADLISYITENRLEGIIFNCTRQNVHQMLKKFAKRFGVSEKVVYPHSFRHMFAIEFLKRNKDISLLSSILGHENISTTQIYLKLGSDEQRNRLNQTIDW